MCLQVAPRRRQLYLRRLHVPFQADAVSQRLTVTVKGDILYLIVVDDIRLRSRIRISIELLFTCGASTRDHGGIDDHKLAISLSDDSA